MIYNNDDFRRKPPFSKGNPDFSFPKFEKIKLKNRNIFFISDNTQPTINIKVLFNQGAYSEKIFGLAHFTAQMLTLGNKNLNAEQIAEKIDFYGAQLSSVSYWDEFVISINCLNEFVEPVSEILFESLFYPLFDNQEIERLKKRQISYIQQQNADPSYIAQIAFNLNFYAGTNYAHPRIGNEESIASIQRNEMIEFYENLLKTDYSIIVSGNFEVDNIFKTINKYLPEQNSINEIISEKDILELNIEKKIIIVDKSDATQANFRLGKPSISRLNPDFPAFLTANTIFGGFFLSRLNENLREKKGLTYGIHSYNDARRYFSTLMISTSINEENSKLALDEIFNELNKYNSEKVTEEELNRAIQYMLGSFARAMENHRQISSLFQTILTSELPFDYYQNIYKKISELTIDDIFEVQKKYYNDDKLLTVISGNKERLDKIIYV